jgi:uncharacterized protein
MTISRRSALFASLALTAGLMSVGTLRGSGSDQLKALIIDGQNNHDWRATTPVLESLLTRSGRFTVEVATTPTAKEAPQAEWDKFRPNFSDFDVVVSNYNGELWPEPVQRSLEEYVDKGGALVIVHAANNAFPQWGEWNKMIGLGWRGNDFGDRITLDDEGKLVRTPKGEGPGASHGPQHEFSIVVRDREHPVTKGMPDELYHGQRGPAQNMHIIATAYSSKSQGGTGAHEPMIWHIPYGKGRVFTTVMGHADYSMKCVGFQSVVARGAEWAATGKVTLPLPENFPTAEKSSSVEE